MSLAFPVFQGSLENLVDQDKLGKRDMMVDRMIQDIQETLDFRDVQEYLVCRELLVYLGSLVLLDNLADRKIPGIPQCQGSQGCPAFQEFLVSLEHQVCQVSLGYQDNQVVLQIRDERGE